MNEALQNILSRRSIRSFTEQKIAREDLQIIAEAANQAPSAVNRQLNQYTVVADTEKIQKLAAAIGKELGREGYDFYKPTAIILCTSPRTSAFAVEDCAVAMENIFLAANALGIGSVWINQLKDTCDAPAVRSVLTELGVPVNHICCGTAALGYAAAPAKPMTKRASAIVWAD